ncbi:MAG: phosphate acetyltransferase, partial [Actinobacteria bacterium]|nr:phosphate acetyltransferase [Actinomycetota bacterium]
LVLTGGIQPAPAVMRLVEGLSDTVPILLVEDDTYSTAVQLRSVRSYISPESPAKIQVSLELFEEWVDTDKLIRLVSTAETPGMTPKMFIYNLIRQAQSNKQHIVLPEGNDERILRAAAVLLSREVVDLTILGDPAEVRGLASRLGLRIDFDRVPVFQPQDSPKFGEYAQTLSDLRKHKGMSLELALDMMTDVSYFGTMM